MYDGASWELAMKGFQDIEELASFSPPRKVIEEEQQEVEDTVEEEPGARGPTNPQSG